MAYHTIPPYYVHTVHTPQTDLDLDLDLQRVCVRVIAKISIGHLATWLGSHTAACITSVMVRPACSCWFPRLGEPKQTAVLRSAPTLFFANIANLILRYQQAPELGAYMIRDPHACMGPCF